MVGSFSDAPSHKRNWSQYTQLLEGKTVSAWDRQYFLKLIQFGIEFEECAQEGAAESLYSQVVQFCEKISGTTEVFTKNVSALDFYLEFWTGILQEMQELFEDIGPDLSAGDFRYYSYRIQKYQEELLNAHDKKALGESIHSLREEIWEKWMKRMGRSAAPDAFEFAGYDWVDHEHRGLYNNYYNLKNAFDKIRIQAPLLAEDIKELYEDLRGLGKTFGMP